MVNWVRGWRMKTYDSVLSESGVVGEQVAREIFSLLPEQGPIVVIMDRQGRVWASDPEGFSALKVDEGFLAEICAKIDDGVEPVVAQRDDCGIVAGQLAGERAVCGYVFVVLRQSTAESTLLRVDLAEALVSQMSLVAELLEKSRFWRKQQVRQYAANPQTVVASN